ncbi:MAG: aldo/keto reductase [Pirellulales bacterium]
MSKHLSPNHAGSSPRPESDGVQSSFGTGSRTLSEREAHPLSRRTFLLEASALSGSALLVGQAATCSAFEPTAQTALPRRTLGRTDVEVSVLALGTAPCGQSRSVDTPTVTAIVREAMDAGINFVDTARIYGNAEEGIGKALAGRRDEVFLTTKVWADDAAGARKSLEESLRAMQTDHVDLVYLHSMGNRDASEASKADGALTYLLKQKETGKTRFVGISGHSRAETFVPLLASGRIDVVMCAMNFVDRYTYRFEEKVLPVARQQNVGIACMKVFGGIRGGFAKYGGPNPGSQLNSRYLNQAVRYALGLPGVATLVIGPHTVEQLRHNIRMVKDYRPLSSAERAELDQLGRQLAAEWGPRFGPVA